MVRTKTSDGAQRGEGRGKREEGRGEGARTNGRSQSPQIYEA